MPYTNIGGTASSVVYYPATSGIPHVYMYNAGAQTGYLGGSSVTSANGFALLPGQRIDLTNAPGTMYGIAGGNQQTPFGTITANTAYGGTALTGVTGGTAFTAGMTVVIDPGTAKQEITSVASSNAGTVNVSPAMQFVHGSAATFSQYVPYATVIRAERGAS